MSLEKKGYDVDRAFKAENSVVYHSLHLDYLWNSVLITIYYKRGFTDEG